MKEWSRMPFLIIILTSLNYGPAPGPGAFQHEWRYRICEEDAEEPPPAGQHLIPIIHPNPNLSQIQSSSHNITVSSASQPILLLLFTYYLHPTHPSLLCPPLPSPPSPTPGPITLSSPPLLPPSLLSIYKTTFTPHAATSPFTLPPPPSPLYALLSPVLTPYSPPFAHIASLSIIPTRATGRIYLYSPYTSYSIIRITPLVKVLV
ncbi:hypothetical protein QBC46DRAFT_402358, partial [Diplogelasinospora grovesii]